MPSNLSSSLRALRSRARGPAIRQSISPIRNPLPSALALTLLLTTPAFAYDNSACWHYAAQQGPRPDITCTPITPALLNSLQNATATQIATTMNEPGVPYPDGTIHYTGNDLLNDGSYQGTIALTFNANNQVTAISAKLNSPTQGSTYLYYRWSPTGPTCSDLPGAQSPCNVPPTN